MTNDPISSYRPPAYPPVPPAAGPRWGGRVVGVAVLVGALAGAATGAGGAALMHDDAAQTVAASAPPAAATASVAAAPRTAPAAGSVVSAAAAALPSVVKIYASGGQVSGTGSGIILTSDGEILTNNHVVEVAASGGTLAVSFNDGSSARATIVGRDPLTDLAVIKAQDVDSLKAATIGDSDLLQVGEQVVALGSPYGLESTVTTGIVSALNRPVSTQGEAAGDPATVFPAIQTDAAINPGNSGGPLITASGDVVGIDSAIKTEASTSGEQSGSIGLGFAIPINDAMPIVDQLRGGETPTHALIGVKVADATDSLGLPDGALVESVDANSAGDKGGLNVADVITRVDSLEVDDADSLVATIRTYRPGDTVTLTISSSQTPGSSSGGGSTLRVTLGSDAG
ncbi:MAG: trypsin-like peptidase domain-containing protein [Propionibacteriales bacterium]|nr:trypsin-like peptidase domain-containing protein [Propionibacteriales bacterium]